MKTKGYNFPEKFENLRFKAGLYIVGISLFSVALFIFSPYTNSGTSKVSDKYHDKKTPGTPILLPKCEAVDWAIWNSFTNKSATGTITNLGKRVSVTMTSDDDFTSTPKIEHYLAFKRFDYAAPNSMVPRTTWSKQPGGVTSICFSETVKDPVILLASLGSVDVLIKTTLSFSEPYVMLHNVAGMRMDNNKTLTGKEGYAIIKFPGDVKCIMIKSSTNDDFTDLTLGISACIEETKKPDEVILAVTPAPKPIVEIPKPALVVAVVKPEPALKPIVEIPKPAPVLAVVKPEPAPNPVVEIPKPAPVIAVVKPEPAPKPVVETPKPVPVVAVAKPEPAPKPVVEIPKPAPVLAVVKPEPAPKPVVEIPKPVAIVAVAKTEPAPKSVVETPKPVVDVAVVIPELVPKPVVEVPKPVAIVAIAKPEPAPKPVVETPKPVVDVAVAKPEPTPKPVVEVPKPDVIVAVAKTEPTPKPVVETPKPVVVVAVVKPEAPKTVVELPKPASVVAVVKPQPAPKPVPAVAVIKPKVAPPVAVSYKPAKVAIIAPAQNVLVKSKIVKIEVWDYSGLDHDSVSLRLNGKQIGPKAIELPAYKMYGSPEFTFQMELGSGENILEVYAVSEGLEALTTVGMLIIYEDKRKKTSISLKAKETAYIPL